MYIKGSTMNIYIYILYQLGEEKFKIKVLTLSKNLHACHAAKSLANWKKTATKFKKNVTGSLKFWNWEPIKLSARNSSSLQACLNNSTLPDQSDVIS